MTSHRQPSVRRRSWLDSAAIVALVAALGHGVLHAA